MDRTIAPTDLSTQDQDDRPLAVHLWFSDQSRSSVFGPLGWVFGYPHITHTITYVLGGNHALGSLFANPYYDNGAIIALREPNPVRGKWYSEKRNIRADIARAFAEKPNINTLKFISVSADTDHTESNSLSRIADLKLSGEGRP